MRTAREIRAALKGEGRVYLREVMTASAVRVFDARVRLGEIQVKTLRGWHTLLIGDEIWKVGE